MKHNRTFYLAAIFYAAILAPGFANEAGSKSTPDAPAFDLKDPARIASGKERFDSTCAQFCHGNDPALFIGRTDLTRQYIYNTIRDGGRGATPMPPWGQVFNPDEIWELVAYVRSLGTPPD